jgi:hypothetical protein
MTKVKCLREIIIPKLGLHCLVGETYEVPAEIANGYDDSFEKLIKAKAKKADVEEDKQSTAEENK